MAGTVAAVVESAAVARDVDVVFSIEGSHPTPHRAAVALGLVADRELMATWGPWLPGFVLEAMRSQARRHRLGVHHTAPAVAAAVLEVLREVGDPFGEHTVFADPAMGGGAFLLAAAEAAPGERSEVVRRLFGCDVDPVAVAATRAALALWSNGAEAPAENLQVADFLSGSPFPRSPDLIVGNPPFLSQLRGDTVRDRETRARMSARWPGVGRYVDSSAAFLLASIEAVDTDGAVALIQPESMLAASDAEAVRGRVQEAAPLAAVWVDDQRRFEAKVDTVALVCRRGRPPERVGVWSGLPPKLVATRSASLSAGSWAPLLALHRGVPSVENVPESPVRLNDVATVTAGFRDQFYGLRSAVYDDPDAPLRLMTSGLIDPLANRWGIRSCRYDKRRWEFPGVDLDLVDPSIETWVAARLTPKLLVASQTRVIEVVVDASGKCVPCTPVVTVEPRPDAPSLWHLAAMLTSPVATARMAFQSVGSALSADAIRVTASRLAMLPLPVSRPEWDAAAGHAKSGDVLATGRSMLVADGAGGRGDLFDWWSSRLPRPAQ